MLIKFVGRDDKRKSSVPVKCKRCGRHLKESHRHEVCNRCRKK